VFFRIIKGGQVERLTYGSQTFTKTHGNKQASHFFQPSQSPTDNSPSKSGYYNVSQHPPKPYQYPFQTQQWQQ